MVRTDFVCLTLVDPRGHVLMQERDAQAPVWPDRWCLPGGGLEGDERPVDGAVRELAEETGVRVEARDLTDLGPFEVDSDHGRFRFHCFVAPTRLGDGDVECHEGRRMVFVDPRRWGVLDLVPSTRVLGPALRDWIAAHRPEADGEHRFAGVILVDRQGRILLQERDEHPRIDPERWGLAGGHLDPGEDFEDAAYRELEEETGVALEPGTLTLFREFAVDHRESYGTWDRMQVFAAATDLADADIDCREGRQIVFVDPERARGLPLSAAAADIVPAFLDSDLYARLSR